MAEICAQLPCKTGIIAGKSRVYQVNQRHRLTPFRYVSVVFLHRGRPLQNLHPLNFHPYTFRRMNIFDQKIAVGGYFLSR